MCLRVFKWFSVTKTLFQVVAPFKPRLTLASVKLPGVCVCVCLYVRACACVYLLCVWYLANNNNLALHFFLVFEPCALQSFVGIEDMEFRSVLTALSHPTVVSFSSRLLRLPYLLLGWWRCLWSLLSLDVRFPGATGFFCCVCVVRCVL